MPTADEMTLAARLVHAGIVPRPKAEAVLKERDSLRGQIAAPSLLDLLVARGLITRTELMIFRDRPLEELQPFPKYDIQGKVAEGGMAQVYRATYKPLDVQVALKVVKPEVSRQERMLLRFRREAGILMKLDHPAIVKGYDLGEQERVWYCAMQYAEGNNLEALIAERGPMPEIVALRAVAQIARAVAYLDSRGIVHRDIKPGNIVMDSKGGCRIIDLGLCLLRGGMKEDVDEGVTVGTVEYLSPEQARGMTDLDVRADLYAIGCTLHHLMTGRVPFLGDTPDETLVKQVLGIFKPERLSKVGASPRLIDLVARLVEKDRDQRVPSAALLVSELEAIWPACRVEEPVPIPAPIPAPVPIPAKKAASPKGGPGVPGDPPAMPKLVSRKDRGKDEPEEPRGRPGRKRRS